MRAAARGDVAALQSIVSAVLFPGEMLPEMMAPFLDGGDCPDVWLIAEHAGRPVGLAFAEPEQMTEGTWNLRAIGVLPDEQGGGLGSALVGAVEEAVRLKGARLLLIDTTGLDDQARARRLYEHMGYGQEARIADFFAPGEDKLTFTKHL
ncbi:MAG: GNAT family N-acetyltransferase [Pseudomonadota bacterium]